MKIERHYPLVIMILIPIMVALFFHINPLPDGFVGSLVAARTASINHQVGNQAKQLQTAVSFYPWRGDIWEEAGIDYLVAEKPAEAVNCLEKALAIKGLSPDGWLSLGSALEQQGDWSGAIDVWNDVLKSGLFIQEAHFHLLHIYISTGNIQAAVQILDSYKGWDRQSASDIFHLALTLSITQPDEALSLALLAEKLDSTLGASMRIIQAGINASNANDPSSYRLILIGRALGSLGEWQLAKNAFEQACQLSPDYAEAWAYLSMAEDQIGQDGELALNRALALKPDSILVQAFQAIFWEQHGKAELALIYLHAIADQEPENGLWQVELGKTLVQMGDLAAALPYFQQAVVVEPENAEYWRDLASFSVQYNVETLSVGLPAARQAVVLDPANPGGLDILGQFLFGERDLSSAERMFAMAVQKDPKFAEAQYHLGMTYLGEGMQNQAFQVLKLAVSLASGQPLADQIQRTIDQYFP